MTHGLRIFLVASLLAGLGAWLSPRRWSRAASERIAPVLRWLRADTPRSRRTVAILIWLVALIPMLHLTYLVRLYGVEVPTLDDWEMAPLIVEAHTGHFSWAHIFEQQQEARTVLPKLIFILSAANGHWDVRDQMMLSVFCCWLIAAGVFILLRRSGLRPGALAICFWLAVLTIFSTAQFELWIFASGFPSFFPALFIVAALVVIGTDGLGTVWKFFLCVILATASSFSLANGLLAWGLTFPTLLLMRAVPRWRAWLIAWVAVCVLCAVAYFWGFQKAPGLTTFAPPVSWTDYAAFILEFLGGGLTYAWKNHSRFSAATFGVLQLALFCVAFVYCVRQIRDRVFLAKALPWFALGAYSIGSAVLAALGRVGYGADYALASRYVTFSLYLMVAVIGLLALIMRGNFERSRARPSRNWSYAICFVLVATYLIPYKACAFNTRFFLRGLSAKDRVARAAVLLCRAVDTSDVIKKTTYPNDARPVTEGADALDRLKLLRPRLIRTNRVDELPHEIADGNRASGSCESVALTAENLIRATGWAVLDAKGRPADSVAVAYQAAPGQEWKVCAISDSFAMRAEIVKRLGTMEQLWSGWTATFSQSAVPSGAKLSFWAIDADEPRLYQLKDESSFTTR
ncbi:MAG: hypothetical protein ACJ8NS_11070 [Chthoniobacterales bacterium]